MMEAAPLPFVRSVDLKIDGRDVRVPEGTTILDAAKTIGIETPTLCYLKTLTPVNACRVCVVEVEGSRVLVPACARKVEPGMVVQDRFGPRPAQPPARLRTARVVRGSVAGRAAVQGRHGALRRLDRIASATTATTRPSRNR